MASTSPAANLDSNSNRSPIKRRKIDLDNGLQNNSTSIDHTRWKTATDQQIYTSNLVRALCNIRRNDSPTTKSVVRETADRVLAVSAKGKTRWSRTILTNRLSLRLCQINRIHKKAKVRKSEGQKVTGNRKLIKSEEEKKEPDLKKKVKLLGKLIPGCKKLSFPDLLDETSDYIAALEMQVRAMSVLTELLAGGATPPPPPPAQS